MAERLGEVIADLGKAWEDRENPEGRYISGFDWDRIGRYIAERLVDEGLAHEQERIDAS